MAPQPTNKSCVLWKAEWRVAVLLAGEGGFNFTFHYRAGCSWAKGYTEFGQFAPLLQPSSKKKINALFKFSFSAFFLLSSSLLSSGLPCPLLWKHTHQWVLMEQSCLFTMKEFDLLVIIDGKSQRYECSHVPAKIWIVLEEAECCQAHRMFSWKIWGPDPVAGESGCNATNFSATPISVSWGWSSHEILLRSRVKLLPFQNAAGDAWNPVLYLIPHVVPFHQLCVAWQFSPNDNWWQYLAFCCCLLKANDFTAGLTEKPPS